MRNHPRLIFDPIKYRDNVEHMLEWLKFDQMNFFLVTKVFCAYKPMLKPLEAFPILGFADSRLENLERIGDTHHTKLLLRLPDPSEADLVVAIADMSLNSELQTIVALNEAAKSLNKTHKIILMVEMGDLREGLLPDDVLANVEVILQLEAIKLLGIGANFSCYGGVMATPEKLNSLRALRNIIKERYGLDDLIISGGNSSSLYMLENHTMPPGIDHLRLGESVILGRETAHGKGLEGFHQDVVQLEASLIEIKEKASYPQGEQGMDAFGQVPNIEDKGNMIRGILAIGKQDVDIRGLTPLDENVTILGGSSDHMIVELKEDTYKVGDRLRFNLDYGSLLRASTSPFVKKVTVEMT